MRIWGGYNSSIYREVQSEMEKRYPGFLQRYAHNLLNKTEEYKYCIATEALKSLKMVNIEISTTRLINAVDKFDFGQLPYDDNRMIGIVQKWEMVEICRKLILSTLGISINKKHYNEHTVYIVKQTQKFIKIDCVI